MKLFDLQLFSEEGGAAADEGTFASPAAENPESNGVATGGEGEQVAPAEEPTFDDLIKGQYKKEFGAKVQEAVNKRFKNQQDYQEKWDRLSPLLGMLGQRYGVGPGENGEIDLNALQQQITNDTSLYEQEAFDRGMRPEDLQLIKQLEYENEQLRRVNEANAMEEQSQAAYRALVEEGEHLKSVYPDFDLGLEMQNPDFGRLIAVDIPLRTAYEIVHKDEIMEGSMRYAVQQTEEKIANSIKSGMKRPAENGTQGQSAGNQGRLDPSKLTREQLAEIKRRAERGERITLT